MNTIGPVQSVVLVGGGQAAVQAIQSLREGGYAGAITLVSNEAALPYQRPPLSKAYMKGDLGRERLSFRPPEWYERNDVKCLLGETAAAIHRDDRVVVLENGQTLGYDALLLATGSRPRTLSMPGATCKNVLALRTISDADRLRPHMGAGQRLLIIGAGYIGLEAAAVARQLGLEVSVVETAPRILARVTSDVMSCFYTSYHRAMGVDIHTNTTLERLDVVGDHVVGAVLGNGAYIAADAVLVGIGVQPNIEIAEAAGLLCDNGIAVDADARTSDPRIFAAGDCASRPLVHYENRRRRLESVHNAIEQAKLAVAAILGKPRPKEECPWFWSDQYDIKLQIAGLQDGYDDIIMRGEMSDHKFAIFYLKQGRLISVDAINSPPEFMMAKKMIPQGVKLDKTQLSDVTVPLRDIAASAIEAQKGLANA